MAAPQDRVQLLKLEDPSRGGGAADEEDGFPTGLNPNEDAPSVRGIFIQGTSGLDELVYLTRDPDTGDMLFRDVVTGAEHTLTELLAGAAGLTENAHKTLRQLIHFIDDGPAEGFASGAYKETTGTVFPTAEIWYESVAKAKKIVSLDTTWAGATITQEQWKVYDTDGSTVLATVTDAISYSGVFETSRTRTIA
jgi:hypothetical protein